MQRLIVSSSNVSIGALQNVQARRTHSARASRERDDALDDRFRSVARRCFRRGGGGGGWVAADRVPPPPLVDAVSCIFEAPLPLVIECIGIVSYNRRS